MGLLAVWFCLLLQPRVAEDLQASKGFLARSRPQLPALVAAKRQLLQENPALAQALYDPSLVAGLN